MNDRDAAALLSGIDGPRPLPPAVADALLASLTDPVARLGDGPLPLPADLRARLEASMLGTARQSAPSRRTVPTAAAAVVLLLIGLLAVVARGGDAPREAAGRPPTTTSRPGADTTPSTPLPGATPTGGAVAGSASGSAAAPPPFTDVGAATADAASPAASGAGGATAAAEPLRVAVETGDAAIEAGFAAYLDVLNAAGGVRGRSVVTTATGDAGAVALVNLGGAPTTSAGPEVVFETVHVDEPRLTGSVVSLASALERQARLAVAAAFSDDAGGRAVILIGRSEPWRTTVPDALDDALAARGVTGVRVPVDGGATPVLADAVFLSLAPEEVASWLETRTGAPPARGTWGVESAWQDAVATNAAPAGLRVLSPYAPLDGDERAALAAAIDGPLSAGAVHGWVTAKALAFVLHENGGAALRDTDLDRLDGWDPGWAPPFSVRPGTRSRTPDAVVLRPDGDRFVADGPFLTAD